MCTGIKVAIIRNNVEIIRNKVLILRSSFQEILSLGWSICCVCVWSTELWISSLSQSTSLLSDVTAWQCRFSRCVLLPVVAVGNSSDPSRVCDGALLSLCWVSSDSDCLDYTRSKLIRSQNVFIWHCCSTYLSVARSTYLSFALSMVLFVLPVCPLSIRPL